MPEFNLLEASPKVVRDVRSRKANKAKNRHLALKFAFEYFDGPREQGYGGYVYDGRWVAVAERLARRYSLKGGDRVLDVGCAKGFLMRDLTRVVPGIRVVGLDISDYALRNAHPDVYGRLLRGSCDALPFADDSFELTLAINTVHNLEPEGCMRAIREIQRVSRKGSFIQVDAYRDDAERELFEDWMLTARTYLKPAQWQQTFDAAGYTGDYYWTILEADPQWTLS